MSDAPSPETTTDVAEAERPTGTGNGAAKDGPPTFPDLFGRLVGNIESVIQGKRDVIERAVLCLLAEGHLLIEDVPGVGKTSLAKALAQSVSARFGRIQFTPDVLPTDVVGVNVFDREAGSFRFRPGPIFNNILLADEINRASPKTQSALLEAMEEGQVTVDGDTSVLDPPFMVIATQNPIEHEGTYPLPESQLDRFLMRITMGYPSPQAGIDILNTHGAGSRRVLEIEPVLSRDELAAMSRAVLSVHIAPSVQHYIVEIAEASRRHHGLALGVSPRATLNLQRTARALAASQGRNYVVPDDLKNLAVPVLAHRLVVTPEAQLQGASAADLVADVLRTVPVPTGANA
jgi:MoxR-like ATPase